MEQIKNIFINLPVKDLKKTRTFWQDLGFGFNDQFSDDKALCLILKPDAIFCMLILPEYFSTFTNRKIAQGDVTQVLFAIETDSREKVDLMVSKALSMGATRYRESETHEWMYYDSFADLDGHQWEVMFSDLTKLNV